MTNIETKALCSVLRKAESQGTESLIDKMIEICDDQSGILLQDLWKWWKEHKEADKLKNVPLDFPVLPINREHRDPYVYNPSGGSPWLPGCPQPAIWKPSPGNKIEITC